MEEKSCKFYTITEEETRYERLKKFAWNSGTKECFGRTGLSWFKIILFYIIFYSALAGYWTGLMAVFCSTIEEDRPKLKLDDSRIGSNPGLGFRPFPPQKFPNALIWFNTMDNDTVNFWIENLNNYLKPYPKEENCTKDQEASGEACIFPFTGAGDEPCSPENGFGYRTGNPCVLIKLNRIYGWMPKNYDKPPGDLLEKLEGKYEKDQIYITCDGEAPADRENMGKLNYYPSQAIPFRYFPFTNQKGYVSPFVFVQFQNITSGVIVGIRCRAWAQNIHYSKLNGKGTVIFELLVD